MRLCTQDALARRLELPAQSLEILPEPWTQWRTDCEFFLLVDQSIYMIADSIALQHKALTSQEVAIAHSPRLLPFRKSKQARAFIFIVSVPARRSFITGVRGYRTAYLQAGVALESCRRALSDHGVWEWHEEFFDDAACRIVGVDGVEATPMAIGLLSDVDDIAMGSEQDVTK